jgi:hypothetical protein
VSTATICTSGRATKSATESLTRGILNFAAAVCAVAGLRAWRATTSDRGVRRGEEWDIAGGNAEIVTQIRWQTDAFP